MKSPDAMLIINGVFPFHLFLFLFRDRKVLCYLTGLNEANKEAFVRYGLHGV